MSTRMKWILAASYCFVCLVPACSFSGRDAVPVNSWWSERGPVVPHDTFPADCTLCHVSGSWTELRPDFSFDHEADAGLPLDGAHQRAECLRCHNDRGPVTVFAGRGCSGCHEDVHLAQLGQNCTDCHGEADWQPREAITRHDLTRFPLVGAHAAVPCQRCHEGATVGRFVGADPDCTTCHVADLARAGSPNHMSQGWVGDCDRCHIPTLWKGLGFKHPAFALSGRHAQLGCEACHVGGQFNGLPKVCIGCHQADYQAANDPNHAAFGFPTACERCHGTWTWKGGNFDHGWIAQPCADCHLADYQATTNPDHQQLGFPLECEGCHSTTSWYGGSWSHDFPINSGDHKNLSCAQCHIVPGDFVTFTCTQCHDHRQSKMDQEHKGESGYVYDTAACYACHPDGKD